MTKSDALFPNRGAVARRTVLGYAGAAAAGLVGLPGAARAQGSKTGIDAATWTPAYISSIAGTAEYDTAAECARVTPLNHSGRLTYWYFGPTQASPEVARSIPISTRRWCAAGWTMPTAS